MERPIRVEGGQRNGQPELRVGMSPGVGVKAPYLLVNSKPRILMPYIPTGTTTVKVRGGYLGDGAHSLGAALPEHQPLVTVHVLGGLDEAEVDRGLVAGTQTVPVHGQDGGRLPDAPTMHWATHTHTHKGTHT